MIDYYHLIVSKTLLRRENIKKLNVVQINLA